MTLVTGSARRRIVDGAFHRFTVPSEDMARYGFGYPLTHRFSLPPEAGPVTAQWRTPLSHWVSIPTAPSGRFDGVGPVARRDGDQILVSVAFSANSPTLDLRVIDATRSVVGTWGEVTELYDDRAFALIFTYDDNPSTPDWFNHAEAHQGAELWSSPGLNPGLLDPSGINAELLGLPHVQTATRDGFIEPANHGWAHVNMDNYPGNQSVADAQAFQARDALRSIDRPPQSRSLVHGYIYPNGATSAVVFDSLSRSDHLTGRLVANHNWTAAQGTYALGSINPTYGVITGQMPSSAPLNGIITGRVDSSTQIVAANKAAAAISYARSNSLPMCHIYAYIRHYDWGVSDPWPQMLATAGEALDIWSVGYGHHALYARTRSAVTVEAVAP